MAPINRKLKASTLLESLVAMVIIVASMGVSAMIYSMVLDSDKQHLKLKAMLILNEEAIQTKLQKTFIDEEKQIDDWTVKKNIEHFPQTENLYTLSLVAKHNPEGTCITWNELILLNQ